MAKIFLKTWKNVFLHMYSGAYGTTLCLSVVASICDVYIAVKRYVINRSADRSIANSYIEIMSI